jgi:hypothetical protein
VVNEGASERLETVHVKGSIERVRKEGLEEDMLAPRRDEAPFRSNMGQAWMSEGRTL